MGAFKRLDTSRKEKALRAMKANVEVIQEDKTKRYFDFYKDSWIEKYGSLDNLNQWNETFEEFVTSTIPEKLLQKGC
jgi:hypothetical protein